ncbi:MAG: transporter substrate-binding domain-containing protein [Oscillospiraceae bacterium]|nr:transporter substrate-binding domain-containing protein [Oscillospiraceae bacterium]
MRRIQKYIAPVLIICFAGCLCSCDNETGGEYRTIETVAQDRLTIAFRKGDRLRDTVTAALKVLADEGVTAQISVRWFGRDITMIEGRRSATAELGYTIEPRTFIAGLCASGPPMNVRQQDKYSGFDAELAAAVCEKLGWELKLRAVLPENAAVELAAGNIDAAWGLGGADADAFDLSPPYTDNRTVLIVPSRSGIKKTGHLNGKTLGIRNSDTYLLETGAAFISGMEKINVYFDSGALFTALNNGQCDAVLTDSLVLAYYLFVNGKT